MPTMAEGIVRTLAVMAESPIGLCDPVLHPSEVGEWVVPVPMTANLSRGAVPLKPPRQVTNVKFERGPGDFDGPGSARISFDGESFGPAEGFAVVVYMNGEWVSAAL